MIYVYIERKQLTDCEKQTNNTSAVISSKLQNLSVQIFKMDAVKACSEVLEFIRESDLNFVFSESPFGANISIKKVLQEVRN